MEANFRITWAELHDRMTSDEIELLDMILTDKLRAVEAFASDTEDFTDLYMTVAGTLGSARAVSLLIRK